MFSAPDPQAGAPAAQPPQVPIPKAGVKKTAKWPLFVFGGLLLILIIVLVVILIR
jgi:hypothetical protein